MESSPAEDLGVMAHEELNVTQQCVLAVPVDTCALGCIPSPSGFCPSAPLC